MRWPDRQSAASPGETPVVDLSGTQAGTATLRLRFRAGPRLSARARNRQTARNRFGVHFAHLSRALFANPSSQEALRVTQ